MSRTIVRNIFAALTLAALAGCGGNPEPKAQAVSDQQTAQADTINNMQAQLSTMQKTITAQQLAQVQAGVDASNADATTKATIAGIISAQAAAPTTASITDYVIAQINTATATADTSTKAQIQSVIDAATATGATTAGQLATLKTALDAATAGNSALQGQVNGLIQTAAALPTTATVNTLIAAQVQQAAATADANTQAAVKTITDGIGSTNLSNAAQFATLKASLDAATAGNAATQAQVDGLLATVATLPTTATVNGLIIAQVQAAAATADANMRAAVQSVTDAATVAAAQTAAQLAALQAGLNGALANNVTLQNQVNLLITATAALPNTATVNSIVAGQIAVAIQGTASAATVQQLQASINATNLSNAGQLSALNASLNAALSGNSATQAQVNGIMATVAAMPTTAQITAMIVAQVQQATAGTASQASVDAVAATVAGHTTTLANLQTALDGAVAGNTTLTSTVNNLIATAANNPTTAQVQGMINTAVSGKASQASVDAITAQVLGQGSALTTAQQSITTLQQAVATLQTGQAANAASIAVLQSAVTADEAAISSLMTQVQTLTNELNPILTRLDVGTQALISGDLVNGGTMTVTVSDPLGVKAHVTVTIHLMQINFGVSINDGSSSVILTTGDDGTATFTLQCPGWSSGEIWATTPTITGIPSAYHGYTVGH